MKKWFLSVVLILLSALAVANDIELVPATDDHPETLAAIQHFASSSDWLVKTHVREGEAPGALISVELDIPSPFHGGRFLSNSVLPEMPHGSIYRFKYLDIDRHFDLDVPFHYVEIDWNTEGLPRGPNGAFINPHFDFHFYTRPRDYVQRDMQCVTVGKTCDGRETGYPQMRRFLNLPPSSYFPANYFPDAGSSIAQMGLHNLDGDFQYSIEHVNHSPVIIYGSFDGQIVFLEASVTLFAFQDAMLAAERNEELRWEVPQPTHYAYAWWPNTMSLKYDSDREVFSFALTDFQARQVTPLK
ncbi:MAG TPA: hypothetical protein VIC53_04045 [Wenzhouxiangella sp.]